FDMMEWVRRHFYSRVLCISTHGCQAHTKGKKRRNARPNSHGANCTRVPHHAGGIHGLKFHQTFMFHPFRRPFRIYALLLRNLLSHVSQSKNRIFFITELSVIACVGMLLALWRLCPGRGLSITRRTRRLGCDHVSPLPILSPLGLGTKQHHLPVAS